MIFWGLVTGRGQYTKFSLVDVSKIIIDLSVSLYQLLSKIKLNKNKDENRLQVRHFYVNLF
jgi:hypothetical protein